MPPKHGNATTTLPPYKYRAEQVREEFLSNAESGVESAVRSALQSLFSQQRLPDNPYPHLASILSAYIDQSAPWHLSNADIARAYDLEGGLELMIPATRLCKLTECLNAWGLPHVLRVATRDGVSNVHSIVRGSLPDSFFPNPSPFSTRDGYTLQVLSSVQGTCASWRPASMPFPELTIRADVIVKGPKLDECLRLFVDLVLHDAEELHAVPVYFVEGITILDAPSFDSQGKQPLHVHYSMDSLLARPDEFEKAASRLVLGNKVLQLSTLLLLDSPVIGMGLEPGMGGKVAAVELGGAAGGGGNLRYEMATKTYIFHYASDVEVKASANTYDDSSCHYGCLPYEALYNGYFLDQAAARNYMQLYAVSNKEPYHKINLEDNFDSMRRQVQAGLQNGASLNAWRQLLLLALLQHSATAANASRNDNSQDDVRASLEDLVARASAPRAGPSAMAAVPNLLRIMASAAPVIQGMVRQLEAISRAAVWWPIKLAAIQRGATLPPHVSEGLPLMMPPGAPRPSSAASSIRDLSTRDSRRSLHTADVSNAMLTWLRTFDMEAKLLTQALAQTPRIREATGKGLFGGLSIMIESLLRELPTDVPRLGAAQELTACQSHLLLVSQLLGAAALTVAHGFVGRCNDVATVLELLGITTDGSGSDGTLVEGAGGADGGVTSLAEESVFMPDWVMDVQEVVDSQVRSGGLAERVAPEGVMLQYAVDTQLDELLATLWMKLTDPPMTKNPYPKLMHLVRSRSAKMELWRQSPEEAQERLCNELCMLRPPMFIYAASPTIGAKEAKRGGRAPDVDDDVMVVYGCYAAVVMADCRALQALRASSAQAIAERHWQSGAYQGEVVPALVGIASISNALQLNDILHITAGASTSDIPGGTSSSAATASAGGGRGAGALGRGGGGAGEAAAPFEHPRFFRVDTEEHHLVAGPRCRDAAQAFAREVIADLLNTHRSTSHIIARVDVAGYSQSRTTGGIGMGGSGGHSGSSTAYSCPATWGSEGSAAPGATRLRNELVDAAMSVPHGTTLACVTLYMAAREGLYVTCRRRLLFQHAKVPPVLLANTSVTSQLEAPRRPTTAERQALLWDVAVYQRIFLSEFNASTWYAWNMERGDPSQPYHYQHMVDAAASHTAHLLTVGRILELQRLLLVCAVAQQDDGGIYQFSRSCCSTAQELRCLQEMNTALCDLMASPAMLDSVFITVGARAGGGSGGSSSQIQLVDGSIASSTAADTPLHGAKVDTERVRRLFLLWHCRMQRALASPRYCYFSGLSIAAPPLLAELREELLSTFRMTHRHLDLMRQLNAWTRACEISVASAVHDCLDEELLRPGGQAARSGVRPGTAEAGRSSRSGVGMAGGRNRP